MTTGAGNQDYPLLSRPNKKDKVRGNVTICYTYYTEEWKKEASAKLAEDMTKQPGAGSEQPPFNLDKDTVDKIVESIMKEGAGEVKEVSQLISILENAGVMEKILKSDFIGSLEVKSYDSDVTRKLERETSTARNKAIFRLFDSDGSGTISAREIAAGVAMHSAATSKEKAALYFDIFDKNRDNKISRAEMSELFKVIIDLWITGYEIKAEGEMSSSIDWQLRWKASEDIHKRAEELKKRNLESSVVSGVRCHSFPCVRSSAPILIAASLHRRCSWRRVMELETICLARSSSP